MTRTTLFIAGCIFAIFCLVPQTGICQKHTPELDSLYRVLPHQKDDTNKISTLCLIVQRNNYLGNFEDAKEYNDQSYRLSRKLNYEHGIYVYYYLEGSRLYKTQAFPAAIDAYARCQAYFEKKKWNRHLRDMYGNLGNIYYAQANYAKSVDYFLKTLRLYEQKGDKGAIAGYSGNIGAIYNMLGDNQKAIEYYRKALAMNREIKSDQGVAINLVCIGNALSSENNFREALPYYEEALKLNKQIGDESYLANNYGSLGIVYTNLKEYDKAIEALQHAISIAQSADDKQELANLYFGIAEAYDKIGNYADAEVYCLRSMEISTESGYLDHLKKNYSLLSEINASTGRYKEALENYQQFIKLKDSIFSTANQKEILEKQIQFDYEKKEAISKEQFEKLQALKQIEIEKRKQAITLLEKNSILDQLRLNQSGMLIQRQQAESDAQKRRLAILKKDEELHRVEAHVKAKELERERVLRNVFICGIVLLLLAAFAILRSLWQTRKSNKIIAQQKRDAEEQRELIAAQKQLVDERSQEITDSIVYAQRLQNAILPSRESILKALPQSFVYYKPKAIVAGDFYWLETIGDEVFIAAADSTGHGVPGAMVSVVCSNALHRAVNEFGLREPGGILDKTRELVLQTFSTTGDEIKDGMDISLCVLQNDGTVKWAGANNPLWYIRENQLHEIKPDKQPIGKTYDPKPFTTHVIPYVRDTQFYLFTDGYADQFGGQKGKKFKYNQFSQLLLNNHALQPADQKKEITAAFTAWQGELEQVDDVCVIGFVI